MKKKKLFDAITGIDDNLIEEAKEIKVKGYKRKRILIFVASIVTIIIVSLLIRDKEGEPFVKYTPVLNIKPLAEVIYPKAYAFEDYDTWRDILNKNPVEDNTIKAINDFAYKTSSLILENSEENINYSPLSLYYALALATTGAEGETEAQLLNLLGMDDSQTLSEQSGNLYRHLYRDNEIGQLKLANSIWIGEELHGLPIIIKDEFIENAAKNFYASSFRVDFSDDDTGKVMSDWISDNTEGTLSPKIKTDSEQILSLINTIYFYDQWIYDFNEHATKEDIFYLLEGSEVKADFMTRKGSFDAFSKGDKFTRAGLSLKNGGEMVFILPDEGVDIYDLLSSPEEMREIFEGGQDYYGEMVWKIPKFSFSSQLSLIENLKTLGVKLAFEPHGEFTAITDHLAFISQIQQETHISIDEMGVEASAFTQIGYVGGAMPQGRADMILNRPFIYGITAPNGNLLFVGICMNPVK